MMLPQALGALTLVGERLYEMPRLTRQCASVSPRELRLLSWQDAKDQDSSNRLGPQQKQSRRHRHPTPERISHSEANRKPLVQLLWKNFHARRQQASTADKAPWPDPLFVRAPQTLEQRLWCFGAQRSFDLLGSERMSNPGRANPDIRGRSAQGPRRAACR